MSSYIMLVRWTEAGREKVKEAPQRVEFARNALKSVGGELKELFFVMGRYDVLAIAEAPNDEAIAKVALRITGSGAAITETLKAFPEAEGLAIIKGLP